MIQDARELGKNKPADDSLLKSEVAQMGEDPWPSLGPSVKWPDDQTLSLSSGSGGLMAGWRGTGYCFVLAEENKQDSQSADPTLEGAADEDAASSSFQPPSPIFLSMSTAEM